jgi:hypothetical protein
MSTLKTTYIQHPDAVINQISLNSSTASFAGNVNFVSASVINLDVASGTWNGTAIGLNRGGTNANLTAINGGIVYSTGSAMAITNAGIAGRVLTSNGAAAPTWQEAESGFNPFLLAGM